MTNNKNNICESFLSNPTINPKTNKKIKIDGPTYKKLMKECQSSAANLAPPASKLVNLLRLAKQARSPSYLAKDNYNQLNPAKKVQGQSNTKIKLTLRTSPESIREAKKKEKKQMYTPPEASVPLSHVVLAQLKKGKIYNVWSNKKGHIKLLLHTVGDIDGSISVEAIHEDPRKDYKFELYNINQVYGHGSGHDIVYVMLYQDKNKTLVSHPFDF